MAQVYCCQSAVFIKVVAQIDEAITWAKDNDQPYKLELLNDLKTKGQQILKILIEKI